MGRVKDNKQYPPPARAATSPITPVTPISPMTTTATELRAAPLVQPAGELRAQEKRFKMCVVGSCNPQRAASESFELPATGKGW